MATQMTFQDLLTTKPFDDEQIKYDYTRHEYYGTSALLHDYGEDLISELDTFGDTNPETLPDRFVREASKEVYQCVYEHTIIGNYPFFQYILAKDPNYRQSLKDWIYWQTIYILRHGDLKDDLVFSSKSSDDASDKFRGELSYSKKMLTDMARLGILFSGTIYIYPPDYEEGSY